MTSEPLMTRQEVADLFNVDYTTTYRIKGLELCRAQVPGLKHPRFVPEKVRALYAKARKAA